MMIEKLISTVDLWRYNTTFAPQNSVMALTPSNMLPLGTLAPDFSLKDTVSGQILRLEQVKGQRATVIMFICNHCPFVKHINPELAKLATDYISQGVNLVAISSNDIV
ncbi:MAG TPA: redoxin domain-containing protein, partial [Chitinophagales bacterium]|nr:redoxin domain-containing protein [Chitinophagales bacterium]